MDRWMDEKKPLQLRETSVVTLPPVVGMPFKITLRTKIASKNVNSKFKLIQIIRKGGYG